MPSDTIWWSRVNNSQFPYYFSSSGYDYCGIPPTFGDLGKLDEVTVGSYYGASTIAGVQGERWASENELEGARIQGENVASIAAKLASEK